MKEEMKSSESTKSTKEFTVDIKEGWQKFRKGVCSVEEIKIIPSERYITYTERHKRSDNSVPFEVIKETASKEIANKIIDNLVYGKHLCNEDGSEITYTFSIRDYTADKMREKQKLVDETFLEKLELSTRVNKLTDKNSQLEASIEFNSRSLFQKIKDYILYRKEFNKNLDDLNVEDE